MGSYRLLEWVDKMCKGLQRNPGGKSRPARDWRHDIDCWERKLLRKDQRNGYENSYDPLDSRCLKRILVGRNCTDHRCN